MSILLQSQCAGPIFFAHVTVSFAQYGCTCSVTTHQPDFIRQYAYTTHYHTPMALATLDGSKLQFTYSAKVDAQMLR
jgi:hypothetical protein